MRQTSAPAAGASVRAATPADREALVALWLELVLHHRRLDPDYPRVPSVREALLTEIARGLGASSCGIWIAHREDAAVGFAFAELERGGPAASPGLAWIHEIYVEPAARRTGVARALVDQALAFFAAHGQTRYSVRVESGNDGGRAFWQRLGFQEKARILENRG